MAIKDMPRVACLQWAGFLSLPIPAEVRAGAARDIKISSEGISELPAPLNKASCWVYCNQAWPHVDPDFEGYVFITLAVRADHRYAQLLPNHKHSESGVFQGSLFTTDPMSLHWLAPNGEGGAEFIGLQFEVPYLEVDAFYDALLTQLEALGPVREHKAGLADALLTATGEWVHKPPGPLAATQSE